MIFTFIGGAFWQLAVLMSIIYSYDVSNRAGLNIGISTSIWATSAFISAVLDRIIYGSQIKLYQIGGMVALVGCGILVSLSEYVNDKTSDSVEQTKDPDAPPIYMAVLWSLIMPVTFACQSMFEKWTVTIAAVRPMDWAFAVWFQMSLVL